jgi:hypothetical protein
MLKFYFIYVFLVSFLNCLNIDDFGAISNDSGYDTAMKNGLAIFSAMGVANSGMDRFVYITGANKTYTMLPIGFYLNFTNVILQIDARVNAYESGNGTLWPKDSNGRSFAMFSFMNSKNLVIKGSGIMEGFGYLWWWNVIQYGHDNRPNLIDIFNGVNTIIDGITLLNSPQYHLNLRNQLNCTVKNVKIQVDITDDDGSVLQWLPTFPLNTDGIDISGKDIYFKNLTIENFDDAIAVKPSYNSTQIFDTIINCTENVLVEDSFVKYGVGMSIGKIRAYV